MSTSTNLQNINEIRIHPELNIVDEPAINVMDANEFQKRVEKVFEMVANTLAKSYGPYGSSTIISNYPFYHVTKDGFSIMKVLAFAKDKTSVDDAIKNLIEGPCTRLNWSVGDGTTTVILAVYEIYKQYIKNKEFFDKKGLSPRDILKLYNKMRDEVIERLKDETRVIDITNHEDIVDTVTKVAYISSNGDEEITGLIHDLYDELDSPMIQIEKSVDGKTYKSVTEGYFFDAVLKDGMYVNNDSLKGEYKEVDVILFDHKVTMSTFENIIYPLNEDCRSKGRHLVIIATAYDEIAMTRVKQLLVREYKDTGSVNLILMVGSISIGNNRELFEDLALLLNTTIINLGIEDTLISKMKDGKMTFRNLLDTNQRGIRDIIVTAKSPDDKIGFTTDNGHLPESSKAFVLDEDYIRVGYAGEVSLGLKDGSTFRGMYYNQDAYDGTIRLIENRLNEVRKKSETISGYNFEAMNLQKRLFNLKMKLGTIYVGGESKLSQDNLYDAVEDAVKASSSAYYNGITKGCSVSILRAIVNAMSADGFNDRDSAENKILGILFDGFRNVYKRILSSNPKLDGVVKIEYSADIDACSVIVDESITGNKAFDITKCEFNDDIINSAKADREILLSTSDLVSLLVTGNQFIVTEREM